MLVRRGMENGVRLVPLENVFQSRFILDVRRQRYEQISPSGINQFLFDLKQLHFRLLDQQQQPWQIGSDLPA